MLWEDHPKNEDMQGIPESKRWSVAIGCVRELIRFRQSEPLSKRVIDCDPHGTAVLTRDQFDFIQVGMEIDEVIQYFGKEPCTENSSTWSWTTMGGSYISIYLESETKQVFSKSFSNTILRDMGKSSYFQQVNATATAASTKGPKWPAVSTEEMFKYCIQHADETQRQWLQRAMSGAVAFSMTKVLGEERIQFKFPGVESGQTQTIFPSRRPPKNGLTTEEIDAFWKACIKLGSKDALSVRNRLMDAVNWSNNFATKESRKALLIAVKQGDFIHAEELKEQILLEHKQSRLADYAKRVNEREKQGAIRGRDYRKEEEGQLWTWYRVLIHERDEYRCQYCGVRNTDQSDPVYHVDHVVPVSRGGRTELTNLQLLCSQCNLAKGNKKEDEFPETVRDGWYKHKSKKSR